MQKPAQMLEDLKTQFQRMLTQENEKTKSLVQQSVKEALQSYQKTQASISKESSNVPREYYEQQIA